MKIALDYDGTVTEDFEAWAWFVTMMKNRGHDVRIVTFRSEDELTSDMLSFQYMTENHATPWKIPIIFTGRVFKQEYCRSIGWDPDVWIDDSPALINHDDGIWEKEKLDAWKQTLSDRLVKEREGSGDSELPTLNTV
jgi:hypothetical protein